jgi:hypothetical protein
VQCISLLALRTRPSHGLLPSRIIFIPDWPRLYHGLVWEDEHRLSLNTNITFLKQRFCVCAAQVTWVLARSTNVANQNLVQRRFYRLLIVHHIIHAMSPLLFFKNEKEQILTTNVWIRHVSNSFIQSRSQMFVLLWKRLTKLLFSRTNTCFCALRMNIFTCAQQKLDGSAEFQIVPTISNQISILYSRNLSF